MKEETEKYSSELAMFDLTLLNAECSQANFDDVVISGLKKGIPPEVLTRLKEIWIKTKQIAGEVVAVGKIIVRQIFDFIMDNPKLTVGLAIGAAVASLIAGIPFFGAMLEPLSTIISNK